MPATDRPATDAPCRRAPRRPALAVAAASIALLLGLSACGLSGDDDAEPVVVTSTEAAGEPVTTVADAPDEPVTTVTDESDPDAGDPVESGIDPSEDPQQRVESVNLTLDDLPEGWVSEPPDDEVSGVVQRCTVSGVDSNLVAKDRSDRFSLTVGDGGLGLDTATGYLVSEPVAEDLMSELGADEFAACATEELLSADGVTVDGALTPAWDVPSLGDETVAVQGEFDMSDTTGASLHLSVIVLAIRTDQVVTTVSATAVDTEGDDALLADVLDLVAERQQA